jgi:hypothetical protein
MGRVDSLDVAYKIRDEETKQLNQSIDYITQRNQRNKRVQNGSFVNMTEKIKQSTRYYWSIDK